MIRNRRKTLEARIARLKKLLKNESSRFSFLKPKLGSMFTEDNADDIVAAVHNFGERRCDYDVRDNRNGGCTYIVNGNDKPRMLLTTNEDDTLVKIAVDGESFTNVSDATEALAEILISERKPLRGKHTYYDLTGEPKEYDMDAEPRWSGFTMM